MSVNKSVIRCCCCCFCPEIFKGPLESTYKASEDAVLQCYIQNSYNKFKWQKNGVDIDVEASTRYSVRIES